MSRGFLVAGLMAGTVLLASSGDALAEQPKVVATIKPLHSLLSGVMDGVATPALLLPGASSPHSYSLRPSDARALDEADLVFWIGEGMETFMLKPLIALSGEAKIVEIADLDGIALKTARVGGAWESHGHAEDVAESEHHDEGQHADHSEEDEDHDHGHAVGEHEGDHHEGGANLHLWLDPHNAESIVDAAVAELSAIDPNHAAIYEANGEKVRAELEALDAELRVVLEPIKNRPYVVFHDAYQYFEAHYGLNAVGSITVSPERPPGAKRLTEIREKIADSNTACVFAEPQFEPGVVDTVIEGTGARKGVLDPLGAELSPGRTAYGALLRGLADSLRKCLSPES